jgi:D-alanyl-D-alanine carboxypeptidase/D-alanyl-D-alanine-endopeptidase (penicillin-binding protein 4)
MRFKFFAAISVAVLAFVPATNSTAALRMEQIPTVFAELTNDKTLANPAMVLIDLSSGATVYSRDPNGLRKPASTLKLMSAFSALEYLPAEKTFTTTLYKTDIKNAFQIVGDFDPSITPSQKLANNLKFVWSDNLVGQIRKVAKSRYLKIRYYGLTYRTKANMDNSFRRVGYHITWESLSSDNSTAHATEQIYSSTSPNLNEILHYTLLFSDNWVADYLAKSAAVAAGYGYNSAGIEAVFAEVLAKYSIEGGVVQAKDGSGLSHEDRTSAATLARVLATMHSNSKFQGAIQGLPVGGVSGTLIHRFIKTAPQAVGLVQAKTGSINGVVSLAGYVDSGDRKYAFAIITDRLRHSYSIESAARATIDKLLGKIAAPLQIIAATDIAPSPSPEPSAN